MVVQNEERRSDGWYPDRAAGLLHRVTHGIARLHDNSGKKKKTKKEEKKTDVGLFGSIRQVKKSSEIKKKKWTFIKIFFSFLSLSFALSQRQFFFLLVPNPATFSVQTSQNNQSLWEKKPKKKKTKQTRRKITIFQVLTKSVKEVEGGEEGVQSSGWCVQVHDAFRDRWTLHCIALWHFSRRDDSLSSQGISFIQVLIQAAFSLLLAASGGRRPPPGPSHLNTTPPPPHSRSMRGRQGGQSVHWVKCTCDMDQHLAVGPGRGGGGAVGGG